GLKTEYDPDWIGRFQAVESKLDTINVNPVLSWEPTKNFTVGGGVNWQRVKATLTSRLNYAAVYALQGVPAAVAVRAPATAAPTLIGAAQGLESDVKVTGNDSGWGWNVGVLWQANEQTRMGAAYRSKIKYDVSGSINISNPAIGPLPPTLAPAGRAIASGVHAAFARGRVPVA